MDTSEFLSLLLPGAFFIGTAALTVWIL